MLPLAQGRYRERFGLNGFRYHQRIARVNASFAPRSFCVRMHRAASLRMDDAPSLVRMVHTYEGWTRQSRETLCALCPHGRSRRGSSRPHRSGLRGTKALELGYKIPVLDVLGGGSRGFTEHSWGSAPCVSSHSHPPPLWWLVSSQSEQTQQHAPGPLSGENGASCPSSRRQIGSPR